MIEVVTGPARCAEWDAYVGGRPDATCYHLSGWTTVAERAYGLRTRLLASRAGPGQPLRGVLPLVVVPRPFQRYVTTGLFGAYGPLLAEAPEATAELLAGARRFTDEQRARYLHIKGLGDAPAPQGLTRQDVWTTARLALLEGPDVLWKRLRKSTRSAVRQAQRSPFTVRSGHEQLPAFYEVLAQNMHRKGSPIYGLRFMRELLSAFGEQVDIVTLWAGDAVVSGALTIAYQGVMTVPFASSRAEWFPARPNNLLYWRLLERACASGLHTFDFGSSLRGTSSLAFKLGWGVTEVPVASYLYARTAEVPQLDASAWAIQAGVRVWRELPRPAADRLGPWVCRFMA